MEGTHKKTTMLLGVALIITLCVLVVTSTLFFIRLLSLEQELQNVRNVVLSLEDELRSLEANHSQLEERIRILESDCARLNSDLKELREWVESSHEYFFFQDGEFIECFRYWKPLCYGPPGDFNVSHYCDNGALHCFYSVKGGKWAGCLFFQGSQPHSWGDWEHILGGYNSSVNYTTTGVTFYRQNLIPRNTYFFTAKFKILRRGFYEDFGDADKLYAAIAPVLAFSFDDSNYTDRNENHTVAIHYELSLSRMVKHKNGTITHDRVGRKYPFNSSGWDKDYHFHHTIGKAEDLDTWYEVSVDMRTVFDYIFTRLPSVDKVTFKCVVIGCDGNGSFIEVIYDKVQMQLR